MAKGQEYLLAHGDEITIGDGVLKDTSQFIVIFPGKSPNHTPTEGVHAHYDMRSEVLGQGAFAIVKKALERSTGNWYAVKIIDKKKVMTGVAVEREIDILKKINHEYVVGLKDFYEDDNNYYLIMDLVSGGDLMDFVTQNGAIPEDAAREITRQVLSAVEYVHSCGISHRDIKPDNILISQDEPVVVKVSDFGLAKISKSGSQLRTFCGTLAYLAPEIMSKKHGDNHASTKYSNKVDIWSIGCMLYVILTSYLPFSNRTQQELYKSVISGRFAVKPLLNAGVTTECIRFLYHVLTVNPAKRPSAAQALRHPWFNDIYAEQVGADSREFGKTPLNNGMDDSATIQPISHTGSKPLRKPLKCPSIKSQRSMVRKDPSTLGLKNPDMFVQQESVDTYEPKDKVILDAKIPEPAEIRNICNDRDIDMDNFENEKLFHNTKHVDTSRLNNNFQLLETGKPRDVLPTTEKLKHVNIVPFVEKECVRDVYDSGTGAGNGILVEKQDSDEDNDDIAEAYKDKMRERYKRANFSALKSSLHNGYSFPYKAAGPDFDTGAVGNNVKQQYHVAAVEVGPVSATPLVSVVRDMDNSEGTDIPLATWMVLRTLDESIPHSNICLTQPCITFGRFSEDGFDIVLSDNRISKMHAVIWLELVSDDQLYPTRPDYLNKKHLHNRQSEVGPKNGSEERYKVWIGDWSRNGCYVNNQLLGRGRKTRLQHGDTIYFLKELRKTELLGFQVNFVTPSAVVSRKEDGYEDVNTHPPRLVISEFSEDPKTFKPNYLHQLANSTKSPVAQNQIAVAAKQSVPYTNPNKRRYSEEDSGRFERPIKRQPIWANKRF